MNSNDYQNSITVEAVPSAVFEALTKQISQWWSKDFEGSAEKEGDEFIVRFGPTFKKMRVTHIIPGKKVEWLCIDQYLEMPPGMEPVKNKSEWVGTTIVWEISADGSATILVHTHIGLNHEMECYAVCEQGWDQSLRSISNLLTSDSGKPFEQLDEEHLELAKQNHAASRV